LRNDGYGWGFVYAFIELFLGISFLLGIYPVLVNAVALAVMSISIVGVLQSVLKKKNSMRLSWCCIQFTNEHYNHY
jgi:hypothetical protein